MLFNPFRRSSIFTSFLIGSRRSLFLKSLQSKNEENELEWKSVFISKSVEIYANLALEDWLYRRMDFKGKRPHQILLLWRNSPSIVIGRHQNPWTEVDISKANELNIAIARRNSGGGCVYHDLGNLNCTFFTPRDDYCRQINLNVICRALQRSLGIQAEISPRLDINIHGKKVSGSASKLGKSAYHHCTLLVNSDLKLISSLLNPDTEGIESRGTQSIKSEVRNLSESLLEDEKSGEATFEKVAAAIGYEFLRTDLKGNDGGEKLIENQQGFQMISPTNDWFPGVDKLKSEFSSWEWNFGKTPDFSIRRSFSLGGSGSSFGTNCDESELNLKIIKGKVQEINFSTNKSVLDSTLLRSLELEGKPFTMQIFSSVETLLQEKYKFAQKAKQTL